MLFNMNDHVKVKLTPHGKQLHRQQYDDLVKRCGGCPPFAYSPVKEDGQGWSKWQLRELMNRFGKHVYNGCEPPFETKILIVTK